MAKEKKTPDGNEKGSGLKIRIVMKKPIDEENKAVEEDNEADTEEEVAEDLECHLLKLPIEVRNMIWEHAVEYADDIHPFQIRPGSTKFYWTNDRHPKQRGPQLAKDPPLAIVSLSLSCRTIYEDLNFTNVFYKINHFDFHNLVTMFTYLYAISPARRASIVSVTYDSRWREDLWFDRPMYPDYGRETSDYLPLLLMRGLRDLTVVASSHCHLYPSLAFRRGLKKLSGLSKLTILHPNAWDRPMTLRTSQASDELTAMQKRLEPIVTQPRRRIPPRSIPKLREPPFQLNMDGFVKSDPPLITGSVSSRTRLLLKRKIYPVTPELLAFYDPETMTCAASDTSR